MERDPDHPHPHPHEHPHEPVENPGTASAENAAQPSAHDDDAPHDDHGHPHDEHGHPDDDHGHPHEGHAPHEDPGGHASHDDGAPHDDHGAPHDDHGHAHEGHDEHDHGRRGLVGRLRDLVRPHSHDAADKVDAALESSGRGIWALKLSLVGLGLTAAFQLVIVVISGSVALLADTVHNFSDALTSVPLWIAFVIARRAPNGRYTYGYHRAEDLAGVFIVLMILLSAALVTFESIQRLLNPHPISNIGWVIAAGIIGFAGNELVALYRIRVGREIGSAALVADGYHARTDGLTSLAVLVGAVGVLLGFPIADPLVGLAIAVVILFVLRDAAGQVFGRLMDAVEPSVIDRIHREAAVVAGVQDVGAVRARWSGHAINADIHIVVDCEQTVGFGHAIAEEVRHRLLHEVPKLRMATIHVDPCDHLGGDAHSLVAHHGPATTSGRSTGS